MNAASSDAPLPEYIDAAIAAARRSPCAKSKRGVVIYRHGIVGVGFNGQPSGECGGSGGVCWPVCHKVCVHAEMRAIREALQRPGCHTSLPDLHEPGHRPHALLHDPGYRLVHVKVIDGALVASGGPSCWQCSREILDVGLAGVWLFHFEGWRFYPADEFHAETLRACELR
jgi:hypothetical protein